ncbi:hypothetical protein YC2023_075198 [Brassica napus]
MSDYFKNRPLKCYTSLDEVILCVDYKQSMYCHLLCGLVQREEVSTQSNFLKVTGRNCVIISDLVILARGSPTLVAETVAVILGGPKPELADLIERQCSQKSWEGIATRLWPNIKYIQCIMT